LRPACWLGLAALLAGSPAAAAPPAKPQHIMSMNLCTDLLVLQLVPKSRLASISYLAHDAVWAIRPGLDAGVATNHGTAEEVVQQRPDLILAGGFSTPTVRRLAQQIHAPLVEVKIAENFDDIRTVTRQVGRAVGEPERAEALIAAMDATLAELKSERPRQPVVVAAWSGDTVPGRGTLANAIIEAAGATNVAALMPDNRYGTFGLEQLLAARPEALLYGGGRSAEPSLRQDQDQHPLLLKLYGGRRIAYPDPLYACGLPQSAEAARALKRALAKLPPMAPIR